MTRSETIREFLQESGSTIISVKFVKKNGEVRKIQFNPRDRQEIVGTGTNNTNPDIIRVRDFSIAHENGHGAWRSFDANRVVSITSNGNTFTF
jgi:hypothetical protein